jgi:hypothetical protein
VSEIVIAQGERVSRYFAGPLEALGEGGLGAALGLAEALALGLAGGAVPAALADEETPLLGVALLLGATPVRGKRRLASVLPDGSGASMREHSSTQAATVPPQAFLHAGFPSHS